MPTRRRVSADELSRFLDDENRRNLTGSRTFELRPRQEIPVPHDDTQYEYLTWAEGASFGEAIDKAYGFFSRHADSHYTANTLLSLQSAAEIYHMNAGIRPDVCNRDLPMIARATLPFSYNEETEVKQGGMIGLLLSWPQQNFKTIVAVHQNARRNKVATRLWRDIASYRLNRASFWVARDNAEGQHWLLSLGFMPTAMNSHGAIRYAIRDYEE